MKRTCSNQRDNLNRKQKWGMISGFQTYNYWILNNVSGGQPHDRSHWNAITSLKSFYLHCIFSRLQINQKHDIVEHEGSFRSSLQILVIFHPFTVNCFDVRLLDSPKFPLLKYFLCVLSVHLSVYPSIVVSRSIFHHNIFARYFSGKKRGLIFL